MKTFIPFIPIKKELYFKGTFLELDKKLLSDKNKLIVKQFDNNTLKIRLTKTKVISIIPLLSKSIEDVKILAAISDLKNNRIRVKITTEPRTNLSIFSLYLCLITLILILSANYYRDELALTIIQTGFYYLAGIILWFWIIGRIREIIIIHRIKTKLKTNEIECPIFQ